MSDYTPTTEAIRGRIVQRGIGWGFYGLEEFDRWLAAHDAEKRAEWEAEQVDMAERWKAVANSADDLLRAVMDALNVRPDQDPVIEARRIAAALAEQGETEYIVRDHYGGLWTLTSSLDEARHYVLREPGTVMEQRKVTPWLPVPGSTVRESDSGVRDSDNEESEGER